MLQVPHHHAAWTIHGIFHPRHIPPLHPLRLPQDLQLRHPLPRRHVFPPLPQLLPPGLSQEGQVKESGLQGRYQWKWCAQEGVGGDQGVH